MKVVSKSRTVRDVQTVVERADITDAEVRAAGYGGRQRWRPEDARITWTRSRHDGQEWSEWVCDGGVISGPKVKQDGTDGVQRFEERIWSWGPIRTGIEEVDDWGNATRPRDDPPEPFEEATS